MKGNSLFQNLQWLGTASIVSKPIWFLFLIYVARVLGPADFGAYLALFSLSLLLSSVLELGLDVQITQSISKSKEDILRLATQSILVRFGTALVLCLLGISAFSLFYKETYLPVVFAAAFSIGVVQFMQNHFRAIFRGMERLDFESVSLILEKIGVPLFMVVWIGSSPTFEFFLISLASSLSVSLSCTFILLVVGIWRIHNRTGSKKSIHFSTLVRDAFPFAVMNFSLIWFARIGSTLIERVLSQKDAGYLGVGTRFLDALTVIPSTLSGVVYPVLCRITDKPSLFSELYFTTSRLANAATLIVVGLLFFFSDEITFLVFGEEYLAASSVVKIYSLTILCLSQIFVFGAAVAALRRQHIANKWLVASVGSSLLLYILLLPKLTVDGFAWLALIDQGLIFISNIIALRGIIYVKEPLFNIAKGLLVFLFWVGIEWLLSSFNITIFTIQIGSQQFSLLTIIIYLFFVLSLWVTGVIQYRDGQQFMSLNRRL